MKSAEDNFGMNSIEFSVEGTMMGGNADKYSELYREMAALIGDAAVHKLWRAYGGLTVSFPSKLYSKVYVRQYIAENMNQMKPAEIAKELKLSDRRVRQIIREIRETH